MRRKRIKVGDRVQFHSHRGHTLQGQTATVMVANRSGTNIGLAFDKHSTSLHNLNGECDRGYGWWTEASRCVRIDDDILKKEKKHGVVAVHLNTVRRNRG